MPRVNNQASRFDVWIYVVVNRSHLGSSDGASRRKSWNSVRSINVDQSSKVKLSERFLVEQEL